MVTDIHKFLCSIAKQMPLVVPSKNMLIVSPTGYFVRGFLFERTTNKGKYYMWLLTVPLFNTLKNVTLNYSKRIRLTDIGIDQVDIFAAFGRQNLDLAQELSLKYSSFLASRYSVAAFLAEFPLLTLPKRPNMYLDSAVAEYLLGNAELSIGILQSIIRIPMNDMRHSNIRAVSEMYLEYILKKRVGDLRQLIDDNVYQNLKQHFPGVTFEAPS